MKCVRKSMGSRGKIMVEFFSSRSVYKVYIRLNTFLFVVVVEKLRLLELRAEGTLIGYALSQVTL